MKKAPKLRFNEFSGDWEDKKLGVITTKVGSGKTPKGGNSVYTDSGIIFLRSQNVLNGKLNLNDVAYISEEINSTMKSTEVQGNDILLNITGASIGRSCNVPKDFPRANVNQHVCIIRLNEGYNSDFIMNQIISSKVQKQIDSYQAGGNREGLNFEQIKSMKVSSTSIKEQEKIASFFYLIDDKISLQGEKVEALKGYKKGMMQKIFSRELRFKDDDKDYPEWEEKTLGEIVSLVKDGTHGTHVDVSDGPYLLSAKNIRDGKIMITESDRKISQEEYNKIYSNYKLEEGDILLSIVGTIGRLAIAPKVDNIAFQRSVAILRFKNDNENYIIQFMNTNQFQNELVTRQVVSAQPGIYLNDLKKMKIVVPCIEEQEKIAKLFKNIDGKIEKEQEKLQYLNQYKKGLLQQIFV